MDSQNGAGWFPPDEKKDGLGLRSLLRHGEKKEEGQGISRERRRELMDACMHSLPMEFKTDVTVESPSWSTVQANFFKEEKVSDSVSVGYAFQNAFIQLKQSKDERIGVSARFDQLDFKHTKAESEFTSLYLRDARGQKIQNNATDIIDQFTCASFGLQIINAHRILRIAHLPDRSPRNIATFDKVACQQAEKFIREIQGKKDEEAKAIVGSLFKEIEADIREADFCRGRNPWVLLNDAREFANFESPNYSVATIVQYPIELKFRPQNKNATHATFIHIDTPLCFITPELKEEYEARKDQDWYQKAPSHIQKLIDLEMPNILKGKMIPTQLGEYIPGVRNVFQHETYRVHPEGIPERIYVGYRSGTLAHETAGDNQRLTNMAISQLAAMTGTTENGGLHFHSLLSPHSWARPADDRRLKQMERGFSAIWPQRPDRVVNTPFQLLRKFVGFKSRLPEPDADPLVRLSLEIQSTFANRAHGLNLHRVINATDALSSARVLHANSFRWPRFFSSLTAFAAVLLGASGVAAAVGFVFSTIGVGLPAGLLLLAIAMPLAIVAAFLIGLGLLGSALSYYFFDKNNSNVDVTTARKQLASAMTLAIENSTLQEEGKAQYRIALASGCLHGKDRGGIAEYCAGQVESVARSLTGYASLPVEEEAKKAAYQRQRDSIHIVEARAGHAQFIPGMYGCSQEATGIKSDSQFTLGRDIPDAARKCLIRKTAQYNSPRKLKRIAKWGGMTPSSPKVRRDGEQPESKGGAAVTLSRKSALDAPIFPEEQIVGMETKEEEVPVLLGIDPELAAELAEKGKEASSGRSPQ